MPAQSTLAWLLNGPPAHITNPPPPDWWDDTYEPFPGGPIRGTLLPCGCHLRQGDTQAILCDAHLAELNRPRR